MNKICETCRWFEKTSDLSGLCCRYPPVFVDSETSYFPSVINDHWCGEWKSKEKQKREPAFVPPTVEEVVEYCVERKNNLYAQAFIDYYEARNWMLGKTKMKEWKAAVRTWEKNQQNRAVKSDKVDQYLEK